VEVIVAVTVLAVGVLGAAASAVPVAHLIRWGGAVSSSATLAGSQVEAMRAAGCAALADGAATVAGGYRLNWTVSHSGTLRAVSVTVAISTGTGSRSETYGALLACQP
jgi:Tfp pilus assembly protein PilV